VGRCEGIEEQFFAIAVRRKVLHPLVQRLLAQPNSKSLNA
jgi:hypothetical protein